MKINKNTIILLFVASIIGLIIGLQFRTINKNLAIKTEDGTLRSKELASELKKTMEERDRQREEIDELNTKILRYENANSDIDETTKELYSELERLKTLSCLTDVKGEGIKLEIKQPSTIKDSVLNDAIVDNPDILLKTVSVLNSADSEAISINGQRISSYSEIERASNNININGVSIASPIIIKAIGDPETLKSALSIKNGIIDQLRSLNYTVTLSKESEIIVEKLNKTPILKYSTSVTDEKK